jgi:hypothetical protein
MTVELLDYDAPSGIELLIAWLVPLKDVDGREVGPIRDSLDVLPYSMVQGPAGNDDKITDHGIYQIDDYATGATREEAFQKAEAQARLTRRRILALGPPLSPQRRVTLSDGSIVWADSVTTSVKYHWQPYGDNATIQRFVSRFAVDLRMVAV